MVVDTEAVVCVEGEVIVCVCGGVGSPPYR